MARAPRAWLALMVVMLAAISAGGAAQSGDVLGLRIIVAGTRDEAERVVRQLRAGGDFAAMARELSVDPSADRGGSLGRVVLSSLRPQLRQALQRLRPGDLSAIVEVPTGFALLQIVPDADGTAAQPPNSALAARGSIRYTTDVAGFGDASLAMLGGDKPADWDMNPGAICQVRRQALDTARAAIERDIAARASRGQGDTYDAGQLHILLGQLDAYEGRMPETVARFREGYRVIMSSNPGASGTIEEMLGVAHLHKAQRDNGLFEAPGDRCLLPVRPAAALARQDDLTQAITYFSDYLAQRPDDLEVRWLLNIASMYAGRYPDRVPESLLIPPDAFESREMVGRFMDVAPAAGLNSIGAAGGVIVDDFDNDGRFDVVTSSMASCDRMQFFHRPADGRFVEDATARGLGEQLGGLNLLHADYDNDGYLDILVLRGGWEFPQRKSLLRNNGDGTFTDVSAKSGLASPATSTQTAVWADFDRDGFLDLFVGNENAPSQLFHNNGDGTFQDVAPRSQVLFMAFTKGVAAADYDNDGWPDIAVSNLGGPNLLFHNNGDGTFSEVGATAGTPGSGRSFATWFFDYDNDGWNDLFTASYFTSVDETARTYLGLPHRAEPLKLYRNRRNGTFEDVTQAVGLDKVFMPMGANFGDIDNDGFLDIYLGTGNPSYASLVPSVLLRNRQGRSFVDVTAASGTGELHRGHGVAFADLDRDGDQEIVFEVGGATPGDRHPLRLFENPGTSASWLSLKLVGVKTNRAAIGARITVTVPRPGGSVAIHRTVGSGGSFGASPFEQHIGLGPNAAPVAVDIWWPTSGLRQHFDGVLPGQALLVTEGAASYVRLQRPVEPLAAAAAREPRRDR